MTPHLARPFGISKEILLINWNSCSFLEFLFGVHYWCFAAQCAAFMASRLDLIALLPQALNSPLAPIIRLWPGCILKWVNKVVTSSPSPFWETRHNIKLWLLLNAKNLQNRILGSIWYYQQNEKNYFLAPWKIFYMQVTRIGVLRI